MVTLTPVGCRLRAPIISGRAVVGPVQGGFGLRSMQYWSCSGTSGWLEFGAMYVSKCEPPCHQPYPRRSRNWPFNVSEKAIVLLNPSIMSEAFMTCGLELLLLTEMNGALPYLFGWPFESVPSGVLRFRLVLP